MDQECSAKLSVIIPQHLQRPLVLAAATFPSVDVSKNWREGMKKSKKHTIEFADRKGMATETTRVSHKKQENRMKNQSIYLQSNTTREEILIFIVKLMYPTNFCSSERTFVGKNA